MIAAVVGLAGSVVVADGFVERIDRPADSAVTARRLIPVAVDGDVVSVFGVGELRREVLEAVGRAAADSGAVFSPTRSASIGLLAVRRGDADVQRARPGYRFPMVVSALPVQAAAAVLGPEVAAALGTDTVVMGQRTAAQRGALAGDVIEVLAANGSVVTLRIALIGTDAQVGGAEIVMSDAAADRLGVTRATRVLVWGFPTRVGIESALARHGVPGSVGRVRVVRSWDPPNPDSTLSTARTKDLLGEFAFRLGADGSMSIDPAWSSVALPPDRQLLNEVIRIRARCHLQVVPALRAALADVAAAGLAPAIDVANTNSFGGCYNPRFNRISGELGFVSRHAWAMALDVNTVSNCQGCVPRLDCRVVQIFRRHGFAWGGNFLVPDGMHFEWVGERRDLLPFPSQYCPNQVPAVLQSALPSVGDSRALLLADQTLATDHAHEHPHDEHQHGAHEHGAHEHDHP